VSDRSHCVVDVDQPASWPVELADLVSEMVERVKEEGDLIEVACSDLPLGEYETDVTASLDGHLLRAYHATRLLPHEAEAIKKGDGLRVLSNGLVAHRLDEAQENGYITYEERDQLLAAATLGKGRADKICFFLPLRQASERAYGFHTLLATWGGEGIYWAHAGEDTDLRGRLRALGSPAIVVAQLDLTVAPMELTVYPGLAHVFTGITLGLPDVGASISYFAPVPANFIEDLIQPGHVLYPSHEDIPQF